MATLKILHPDGTTNYVKNPALRDGTTGYTAAGATISRTTDYARFGIASLKIVTNGSTINEGAYYRVNDLQGISEPITVSVYVRGTGKVRICLINNPNGKQWASTAVVLSLTRWTRLSVSGFSTGSNDLRLYVETYKSTAQAVTFYADGFQMERKAYPTTYTDGDQPGCMWNGVYHNSTSSRRSDTRDGGRWVSLTNDPDLYFTTIGGLGVAPIRNNIQPYADAPGSYYQNSKTLARAMTILFHAKNPRVPRRAGERTSLDKLHSLRQTLFDLIKPDKTAGGQEFLMEYQDGDFPVYFSARYDTGLEGEWDVRNQWVQSFPVRFLIVSPYITNDSYDVASLSVRERATVNYVLQRFDGAWRTMNGGMNNQVYEFAIGPRGQLYAVGVFTRSNNATTATDPQIYSNFIAYWDGTQWQKLGSGANGTIHDISVAANGYVYVTGEFTSIGGVAANRAAYWDGSAWNAMGTGLNGIGYAVAVSPDGNVYFGGAFTTAGGNNAYYFARWNGSGWFYGGTYGGVNNTVYALAVNDDGTEVYLGGAFTDEYSSPAILNMNYVGMFALSTNQFSDMATGFDATVRRLRIAPSGKVYACGDFTATGAVTPDTTRYIAYWNGTAWFPVGIGADNIIRNIHVAEDETVIVVGDFTSIGGVNANYCAFWNGTDWVNLDIDLENAARAVIRDQYGNIVISPNGTLVDFSKRTTITNNGTAETNPVVYIKGPCTLRWLENQTAKKRLYADLTIQNTEEVFIDFAHGLVESTVRGDVSWAIQPGSDMRSWSLLPGDNIISAFLSSDIGAVMQIGFAPRFWSADSTVRLEDW